MPKRRGRIAAPVLAVIAALCLLTSVVLGYAWGALFDSDEFATRATAALDNEAVSAEVAKRVTNDLVLNAEADLVGFRPVIESVVQGLVRGGVFQGVFRTAAKDVHRSIFDDDDATTVTLTLGDVGAVLKGALEALQPKISKQIPGGIDVDVLDVSPPSWLADVARTADGLAGVTLVLFVLALVLIGVALWVSPDRRRTVLHLGIAVIIVAVAAVVAISGLKAVVVGQSDEQGVRDAIAGIWDAFLGDLSKSLYLFAAAGAVIAAAASSLLRPVELGGPLRAAERFVTTIPERRWLRVARALALIVIGIVIVVDRSAVIELVVICAGLFVVHAGVSELMRMLLPDEGGAEAEADRAVGRRALIAAGIGAAVIVIGGGIFISTGGIREAPAAIETEGCNGSDDLCDRPLNEVAFASTHNAMSAVTNPNWLFGQQDAGFPDQLHDGIRGLFIDAHYGVPTEAGAIKTDLSDLDATERAAYEDELGADALDAALRIRDRIVNSPANGPRGVYLCHRFCELGAIPILGAFKQYRDFLAANPDEVLAIVVEDYVRPADVDEAVRASGLIDYVYRGPLGPPWPTLQQMIDSHGRVLMLSENEDGGTAVPYYHAGYRKVLQETPYSFNEPGLLTDPKRLHASCQPNRGPKSATLFLVNHWIDTSPAPRPSNAAKVNTRKALLARVHQCERQRGLLTTFLSVDFYREGDLFGAVEELNAERGGD